MREKSFSVQSVMFSEQNSMLLKNGGGKLCRLSRAAKFWVPLYHCIRHM